MIHCMFYLIKVILLQYIHSFCLLCYWTVLLCGVLADESWRRQLARHALVADRALPCCWSRCSCRHTAEVDVLCKVCRLQCCMPKHYCLSFWSGAYVSMFLTTRHRASQFFKRSMNYGAFCLVLSISAGVMCNWPVLMVRMSWTRSSEKPPLEKIDMEFLQAGCR